jgi:hypothetical protein
MNGSRMAQKAAFELARDQHFARLHQAQPLTRTYFLPKPAGGINLLCGRSSHIVHAPSCCGRGDQLRWLRAAADRSQYRAVANGGVAS